MTEDIVQVWGIAGAFDELKTPVAYGGYFELDSLGDIAGQIIDFPRGESLIVGKWRKDNLRFVKQYEEDKTFEVYYDFQRTSSGELWTGKYKVLEAGKFEGEGLASCVLRHFGPFQRRMTSQRGLEFPIFLE
jgi:hypothetical protein